MRFFNVYLLILTASLGAASFSSAASADYSPSTGDPMLQWCDNVLRELAHTRRNADDAMAHGDYAQAQYLLSQGLSAAATAPINPYAHNGPITSRAIQNVLAVSNAVIQASQGATNSLRTNVYFLYRAYDFISNVAYNLDVTYYIPYRHRCRDEEFDMREYEDHYLAYVQEEVQMVLDTLAQASGGDFVTPIGAPRAFLAALSVATLSASNDLRQSIFATYYACTIEHLADLSSTLASYLQSGQNYYNEPDAFQRSYHEASHLVARITYRASCEYDGGYDGEYGDER